MTHTYIFPADVVELSDGRVLAVYGYRRAPWGVRACISDDGVSWDRGREFTVREGGAGPATMSQYWHIGYPSVAQMADGAIAVAYHEYVSNPGQSEPIQAMWVSRFRL